MLFISWRAISSHYMRFVSDSVFDHHHVSIHLFFFFFFTTVVPVLLHFQAALWSCNAPTYIRGNKDQGLGCDRLWEVLGFGLWLMQTPSSNITMGSQGDNGLTFPEVFFSSANQIFGEKGSLVIFTAVYCQCIKLLIMGNPGVLFFSQTNLLVSFIWRQYFI